MTDARTFSLDELCILADLPRRTVRYYIQLGMVERPDGETRAARYGERHLAQLLTIKKATQEGRSLDSIREAMAAEATPVAAATPRRRPGSVEVWSHLMLAEGVELMIEPGRAGLTPGQVRELLRKTLVAFEEVRKSNEP